jgi:hypothetical protein
VPSVAAAAAAASDNCFDSGHQQTILSIKGFFWRGQKSLFRSFLRNQLRKVSETRSGEEEISSTKEVLPLKMLQVGGNNSLVTWPLFKAL